MPKSCNNDCIPMIVARFSLFVEDLLIGSECVAEVGCTEYAAVKIRRLCTELSYFSVRLQISQSEVRKYVVFPICRLVCRGVGRNGSEGSALSFSEDVDFASTKFSVNSSNRSGKSCGLSLGVVFAS